MSESNNLLKKIGRVFLETVIESLEESNESLNTNVNSRGPSNIDVKGKLYGDVYDKNKKHVLDSYVSSTGKAAYIGDIYSEKGNSGYSLPILKNGTGYDAQFNGTVGGALSGLIYNYDSARIELIRNSIIDGNTDEVKKARLILDPGHTDALDGSAKYYGDVYSTYYDGSDTDNIEKAELLIDSKIKSANFTGGITGDLTGNVTGNAGTVTNGVYTTGNQTITGEKTFNNSDGITCSKFKSANAQGMVIQTGANNNEEGILFKRYYIGTTSTLDNDIMFLHRDGNVGIGNTVPVSKLHVGKTLTDASISDQNAVTIIHPTNASLNNINDPKDMLYLGRGGTGGVTYGSLAIFKLCKYQQDEVLDDSQDPALSYDPPKYNVSSHARLDIAVSDVKADSSSPTVMSLRGDGNVGIGTTTPSHKLDVNGNINVTGTITYNGGPIIIGGRGTTVANVWTWTKFNKAFDATISVGDIAIVATVVRSDTQALTDMITYQIRGIATDGFYVNANEKDGRNNTNGGYPYSGDFSYIATAMK